MRGLVHAQLKENAKAEEDFQRALQDRPEGSGDQQQLRLVPVRDRPSAGSRSSYFLNALKDPLYETPDVAY